MKNDTEKFAPLGPAIRPTSTPAAPAPKPIAPGIVERNGKWETQIPANKAASFPLRIERFGGNMANAHAMAIAKGPSPQPTPSAMQPGVRNIAGQAFRFYSLQDSREAQLDRYAEALAKAGFKQPDPQPVPPALRIGGDGYRWFSPY